MPATSTKGIPKDMHALTPHIVCKGAAKAIDFYKAAFGAEESGRMAGPDGRLMHASVRIGDSTLMMHDEMLERGAKSPQTLGGTPVTIHLYVSDSDATVARAVAAGGAQVLMPPADMFWGDRYAQLEDPFGHRWGVATHLRDLRPEEIEKAMRASMPN
jgi:uncharacterized glyoxalase superfamily protein PhnB